ncbi:MAG: hypothetical protein HYX81_01835 [Chloroflexi bacterium]|nr:hypothetical protein [Chloroflexota bacterium]
MKFCIRKIYCPNCQSLVKCREEAVSGQVRIHCSRCNQLLWRWDGTSWIRIREEAAETAKVKAKSAR